MEGTLVCAHHFIASLSVWTRISNLKLLKRDKHVPQKTTTLFTQRQQQQKQREQNATIA